ncbi:hypothetical protein ACLOJK_039194, partial [Asimina triloba]
MAHHEQLQLIPSRWDEVSLPTVDCPPHTRITTLSLTITTLTYKLPLFGIQQLSAAIWKLAAACDWE